MRPQSRGSGAERGIFSLYADEARFLHDLPYFHNCRIALRPTSSFSLAAETAAASSAGFGFEVNEEFIFVHVLELVGSRVTSLRRLLQHRRPHKSADRARDLLK